MRDRELLKVYKENRGYFFAAVVIGLATGLVGTGFHLGADALSDAYTGLRARYADDPRKAYAVVVAVSACAALAAAALVRRFAPETAGSGIPEIESAMQGLKPLRWGRVLLTKFTGGLLSLGSGMVLGREGPTIHMGGAIAEALSDGGARSEADTKGLIGAGAAAGLAAAFNAPLAAVLFIREETSRQFPFSYRTYMAVIIAALCSALVTETLLGQGPLLGIQVASVPGWIFPIFVALGIILGLCGVLFNWALPATMDLFGLLPRWLWWLPALIVGGATGALLIFLPEATHGGEALVLQLTSQSQGLAALLILTAIRFSGVLFAYSTGVPGGIFAPMLSIATCVGLAFGTVVLSYLPSVEGIDLACAIAAMGGFFAASVRAPLVGVVLVLELTGAYDLLVPMLLTCATAAVVAEQFGGRPIYEVLLDRSLRLSSLHGG